MVQAKIQINEKPKVMAPNIVMHLIKPLSALSTMGAYAVSCFPSKADPNDLLSQ